MATTASSPERFGLIVGAMKCGTTSVFNYLSAHPEVAPCRVKEPNYFSSDDFQSGDLHRYLSLWNWEPGAHKVAIEASVNYTKIPSNPDCAERIAQFPSLDFRFIYCMRNPIDRIESHVYHGLYAGWTKPLDAGISEHAIDVSRYAMQLDAYTSRFGRERIHLVVLEEFEERPREVLRQICEFLEIDPSFEFELDRSYNRASDHYLEHPLWTKVRGVELLRRLSHAIPTGWRRALLRSTGRKFDVRRRLSASERSQLAAALKADLARLRSEYGIDAAGSWGAEFR